MTSATLSALLKSYRARHGLTQEALGLRWGVSTYTVRGWEAGRSTTHQAVLVALLVEVMG